ncbi:MAG: error-prone DNA polymerase, partial [Gammaproteobacteria bacterium]
RGRRPLQDLLTAIRHNRRLDELCGELYPNGERHLRGRRDLAGLYPPELLAETVRVAERCRFSLTELCYAYPNDATPAGTTPRAYLRHLTLAGMARRWPAGCPPQVRGQIEHELGLIAELAYEPYFLTVWDIVRFARAQDILCQGRGSAANSAVCYCLGITEVDPARMNLLFERFISRERGEPPDIDVDFEHERREEVIQYIYRKYGRERAALAATLITYRNTAWWDKPEGFAQRIAQQGFDADNLKVRQLLHLVQSLMGFPRHLSQHVGGFVIARDHLPSLVPVENAAMPERTVIQWDKDDLETLGLLKVDILALGMLSAIRKALDFVGAEGSNGRAEGLGPRAEDAPAGEVPSFNNFAATPSQASDAPPSGVGTAPLGPADIPAEDPDVYAMIQAADTVGVFQIESRAQMSMLPRLRPACFYDLVIEVAIVRPGP